ncbi:3'-5' exonuclease [Clostridium sp. DJ247]|uniref:3'-5' exonuclease n=1 Tax=Clostridium sp. DJ247 TaxID=2726188 RepID=UPI00162581EF|nr:3'-5' exonuclease [Clostridium sp. DJ247]MBC2580468.1 exonuclease domain-containing protein [Clostridium sp. DJ247]
MNYIIFDLEFNQGESLNNQDKNTSKIKCPFEIIQIGAIKLDKNFNTVSTLDALIKPEIYTSLNSFVKEITRITMDSLNNARSFKEVYKDFLKFITEDRSILCVWGMADMKELLRNISYHEFNTLSLPREYINIQRYASKYFNCPKGINIGLQKAVELLNIPLRERFHNAVSDAYYTAEVFKKIHNEHIKPKIYNWDNQSRSSRHGNIKQKIDMDGLLKQFEKMFNREMNEDEKSIIKLAYIMGKTNQFKVEVSTNPDASTLT